MIQEIICQEIWNPKYVCPQYQSFKIHKANCGNKEGTDDQLLMGTVISETRQTSASLATRSLSSNPIDYL